MSDFDEEQATAPPGEQAGDWIGRYRLVEPIGEGGMGTVWRAEQEEPIRRSVALKIIKLGMDTKEVVARFEAERQVLAMMDHPHVAKVLDGGATQAGRPFFVMELVDGVPITQFCDRAKLSLGARLRLFVQVCGAIQHAHQKGIIHRDVKPSNVLVGEQDGKPVPKVIDFGIAKATASDEAVQTMLTELGQIMGTPEYMAPEQSGTGQLDVDTRADVYALGVLLYELLTGTKVFDLHKALEAGYAELLRLIREVDPQKPSTRISTLGEQSQIVAARRHTNPQLLGKRLRGDLDWIVMKAMEKDRARRYDTAAEFASDIERFLANETVMAAPPSLGYRMRKLFVRRKKTVAAVALIGVLFLAGSIGTGVGWWKAQRANRALDAANQDLGQVVEFLSEQLAGINVPAMGHGLREGLLLEVEESQVELARKALASVNFTNLALAALDEHVLQRSEAAIDSQFLDQPLVRARLLNTLGRTMHVLGLPAKASEILEEAYQLRVEHLGPEDAQTLDAMVDWGIALTEDGAMDRAQEVLVEAVALDRRVLGDNHAQTAAAWNALGRFWLEAGRFPEAEKAFQAALDMTGRVHGEQSKEYATGLAALGGLMQTLGRLEEAAPLLERSLALHESLYPDTDPNYLAALSESATLWQAQGKLQQAEEAILKMYEKTRVVLGDLHPDTLTALGGVGYIHYGMGRMEEAEQCFRDISEGLTSLFGEAHPETLQAMGDLAAVQQALGKLDESAQATRKILDLAAKTLGLDHRTTLIQTNNLSHVLWDLGRSAEALELCQTYYEGVQRVFPDDQQRLANAAYHLGVVSVGNEAYSEAEAAFLHVQSLRADDQQPPSWRDHNLNNLLGLVMAHQGRWEEAEPLLVDSAEALIADPATPGPGSPQGDVRAQAMQRVIESYERRHADRPDGRYQERADHWQKRLKLHEQEANQ